MEVHLQLILTVCIVHFGSTNVLLENQSVNQLHNFFDSIAKNDLEKSKIYRESLKDDQAKEKHAFDAMKKELKLTQVRNFNKRRGFSEESNINANIVATKRETKQYKHVPVNYVPIIPDISNKEAMKKLKELWIKQSDYLKSAKLAAENVVNKHGHKLRQFGWVYNDTEERIKEQIEVLSNEPWKNDDKMKNALDSDTIVEQNRTWYQMDKCLDDHYEFKEKDDQEKYFRELLNAARTDLQQRETEIKSIVNQKEKSTQS